MRHDHIKKILSREPKKDRLAKPVERKPTVFIRLNVREEMIGNCSNAIGVLVHRRSKIPGAAFALPTLERHAFAKPI
jgi:hypothetical protein